MFKTIEKLAKNSNKKQFLEILAGLNKAYDENRYDMNVSEAVSFYNKTIELLIRASHSIMKMAANEDVGYVENFIDLEPGYIYELLEDDKNMQYLEDECLPIADTFVSNAQELTNNLITFAKFINDLGDEPVEEDDEDIEYENILDDVEYVDDEDDIPIIIIEDATDPKDALRKTKAVLDQFSIFGGDNNIVQFKTDREEEKKIVSIASKMTTKDIYKKIKDKVYKQDDYCKAASVIVYNHLHGINSTNVVSGPSGCGKTFLWETVRDEVYSNVCFLDGKSVTQAGFKGINLHELLSTIPFTEGIVVIDEFDKLITASYDSHGTNISRQIQGEFLKVLDSGFIRRGEEGSSFVSTDKMTFILCGSFFDKADEKSEEDKSIGFYAQLEKKASYETSITLEDMIEFGLIKEIAGRITDVVNVNPLTVEDYITFIKDFNNSAVKQIEDLYGLKVKISDKKVRKIAEEAFKNALGLRKAIGIIKSEINRKIFDDNEVKEITLE